MGRLRLRIPVMIVNQDKSIYRKNYLKKIIIMLLRRLKPFWQRLTQWFSPNIRRTSIIGLPVSDYGRRLTGGRGSVLPLTEPSSTIKWLAGGNIVSGSSACEIKSDNTIRSMSWHSRATDPGAIPGASTIKNKSLLRLVPGVLRSLDKWLWRASQC